MSDRPRLIDTWPQLWYILWWLVWLALGTAVMRVVVVRPLLARLDAVRETLRQGRG